MIKKIIINTLICFLCTATLSAVNYVERAPAKSMPVQGDILRPGTTDAYLKQVPFETIIRLYGTHEMTKEDTTLAQFAQFFQKNRALFSQIMRNEQKNAADYYVFYHGVNGQRLYLDVLRLLYNRTHAAQLPEDFLLLRDPRDLAARSESLQEALANRWPQIPPHHQKILLETLLHRPLTAAQVPLLWKLISADIDWNEDLTHQERALLKDFSQESILDYHRQLIGLARLEWNDPNSPLSAKEKRELFALDTALISRGHEMLLRALYILENNVDYTPGFRPRNLAVNLSLFSGCIAYHPFHGLHPTKDECTPLYWFAEGLGYHQFETSRALRELKLLPLLDRYGIPASELKTLESIYQTLKPEDDQLLLQILVPKEERKKADQRLLNAFFYISHPAGRPAYYLSPLLATQVLDLYQRSPLFLPAFLQLQGRFLFTEAGLLNPQSGIRMVVYHLPHASQERIQRYLFLLNQWALRQNLQPEKSPAPRDVAPGLMHCRPAQEDFPDCNFHC